MASEEDVLLREVDEDLSRDQVFDRIRRYRIPAAIGAAAIIGAVATYQIVDGRENAAAAEASARYAELSFAAPAPVSSDELTSFAETTDTGYAVLARMRAASALAGSGNAEGAAALYAEVYNDSSVSGAMQDFARVRAAYAVFDADPARASEIASGVVSDAFRGHADEIAAAAALLNGNYVGAEARFEAIAEAAPLNQDFFRTRAESFAALADAGANGADLDPSPATEGEVVDFIRSFGAELESTGVPMGVEPGVDVLPEPPITELPEAFDQVTPAADAEAPAPITDEDQ